MTQNRLNQSEYQRLPRQPAAFYRKLSVLQELSCLVAATSFDARPNEVYMKAQLAKALPQHRILTQEMRIGSVLEACPPFQGLLYRLLHYVCHTSNIPPCKGGQGCMLDAAHFSVLPDIKLYLSTQDNF